ncbi:MAG TPA: glycogen/starch/alpha-glucan phosphorylase [Clostridia bacterium]|jgi:starch phosphorylase|nr:glycogen/starch/alpha-glucan phosphorylase [Clostridia bacterium]HOL60805.1 glycogen/starch/alpha-glucan phosphorylase [Clostridia bacterium]HPO53501.1 glycogen/starch/alpha-glucan phosphorylase [Clostridia bacterium]
MYNLNKEELKNLIKLKLAGVFGVKYDEAGENLMYRALCLVAKDLLTQKRLEFKNKVYEQGAKQVYYMSMEFLLGRSLRNHLYNMGLLDTASGAVSELGYDINKLIEIEPDAGLGNGGLGRLAAAYMDSLTSLGYAAGGFSIRYDYGIFKQKIVDGWQMEMPDDWLQGGDVWLNRRSDVFEVKFGGTLEERWENGRLIVEQKNATTILAIPYDMNISGYGSDAVNTIRLWSAKAPVELDMTLFSRGEYVKSIEAKAMAEAISKVLYPADNHIEGKSLRLKQQYFFVSASMQTVVRRHLRHNNSLDSLPDKVAIHINDTHPALCIPELMRLLMDEHGYGWDDAWRIVTQTVSYTNHTVMQEALERWPQDLFEMLLPRITQIIKEINKRYCEELWQVYPGDWDRIARNAIVSHGEIRMANLCLAASHTVNGVSALHSDILKNLIFADYYKAAPQKFTNVTNGITHRRWTAEANPLLTNYLKEIIGDGFLRDAAELEKLMAYHGNGDVLKNLAAIKRANKVRLSNYILKTNCVSVSPDAIFDVQVKRLHEYKRQLLNALHIMDLYSRLKENPDLDITPRVFIFGAKAASSYYMAKQIIRLINMLGEQINRDKSIKDKLKVVFLENYCVSLAELIMPAAEISEQISIAGKEASGTGNMKFMINGAVTMGTMDGANVEIFERVGKDNIFIFGLSAEEAESLRPYYSPSEYYAHDCRIQKHIETLRSGVNGVSFNELADSLVLGQQGFADPYMVLADFASYVEAQGKADEAYKDFVRFNNMSLVNIAKAGFFAADRSVEEYASRIWRLQKVK